MVFELIARIGVHPASQEHGDGMKRGTMLLELAKMFAWNVAEGRLKCKQNRLENPKARGEKMFETEAECYRSFFVHSGVAVRRTEDRWRRIAENKRKQKYFYLDVKRKKGGRKEKKIKTDKKKKRKRRGPYTRVLVPSPSLCL